jgi:prolyl-tRNA synthetase
MLYSQLLIPTVKEVPAEAEIPSHQLMIRAGLIRKLASGTYTYLPLGWRILRKIMQIIREEMDSAGAQEILMPILQPMELWQQTGRDRDYGPTMFKLPDRKETINVLAPTAEEVVTDLVCHEVSSYKQLPLALYQINTKFRDELRPRFGVLRSREFIMKDAYSFHTSVESLEETYRRMYDAYCRIFARCGLSYVIVEAESGPIGGSASHEFMVPCAAGEDVIVHTADGSYAANIEKAEVDPPAATGGGGEVAPMEQVHTPNVGSIEAVCAFLKTQPSEMIKTLIFSASFAPGVPSRHNEVATMPAGEVRAVTAVCVVRGDHEINLNKVSRVLGASHVELAGEATIQAVTGAAVGFAGPMGMSTKVERVLVDHAVAAMASGVAGANRTDYHVRNVVPGRDFPLEGRNVTVADIRNAAPGDTRNGAALTFSRGIEVGHVFKLGTKYSTKLSAYFLDEKGQQNPCIMGCYGIGVNRILASAIEAPGGHDDNGCILPSAIAPFGVVIVPINFASPAVASAATRLYDELRAAGVDVLLDDRDARPGVKFKDADLLGLPVRIVVGEKGLKDGKVEIKRRTDAQASLAPLESAAQEARRLLQR